MVNEFDDAISVLPKKIREVLNNVTDDIKGATFEIRFRRDKPLVLYGLYGTIFVRPDATVSSMDAESAIKISADDVQKTFIAACDYSVYSHQNDIANGFVTYGNGNRAGFCGNAVIKNNSISAINNIKSINLRICRDLKNSATELLDIIGNNFKGIILAGPPCSGKTTMLRSIAHKLSSEYRYGFKKCVLIDERYEMEQTDGLNLDILSGYPKALGIIQGVRVLSPDIVLCDEITTVEEARNIIRGMDSGVKFIVSTHAENKIELLKRESSEILLKTGCFDFAVILKEKPHPCSIDQIYSAKELTDENHRNIADSFQRFNDCFFSDKQRIASL